MKSFTLRSAALVAILLGAAGAHGVVLAAHAEPQGAALFGKGTRSLGEGAFNDAIAHFEQLSDLGLRGANASFNRALAYLKRAESTNPRPGDWGQAVAGFREATLLGADDPETADAVEKVRHAIARQRSSRGLDPVVVQPSLGRAALQLIPENVWAVLAVIASFTLLFGLSLSRKGASATRGLTARICVYAGLGSLLLFASLSFAAKSLRQADREAVVVVPEARMLDAQGKALKSKAIDFDVVAIPEGASVFAGEQRGRLVRVHWGSSEAWVHLEQLRFVTPDPQL